AESAPPEAAGEGAGPEAGERVEGFTPPETPAQLAQRRRRPAGIAAKANLAYSTVQRVLRAVKPVAAAAAKAAAARKKAAASKAAEKPGIAKAVPAKRRGRPPKAKADAGAAGAAADAAAASPVTCATASKFTSPTRQVESVEDPWLDTLSPSPLHIVSSKTKKYGSGGSVRKTAPLLVPAHGRKSPGATAGEKAKKGIRSLAVKESPA
ncbi:unnamed protein product, partial [Phaeothamnion confervicola]